jgi:hypothetical protein
MMQFQASNNWENLNISWMLRLWSDPLLLKLWRNELWNAIKTCTWLHTLFSVKAKAFRILFYLFFVVHIKNKPFSFLNNARGYIWKSRLTKAALIFTWYNLYSFVWNTRSSKEKTPLTQVFVLSVSMVREDRYYVKSSTYKDRKRV